MESKETDIYSDNGQEYESETFQAEAPRIVLGILFTFISILGVAINSAIIHAFRHSLALQTPPNLLIIGCVVCDITLIVLAYPFAIASYLHGRWLFGAAWCEGYGFVLTLLGVSSFCIFTAVAIDRYFIITESPFAKKITSFKAAMTILSCLGYGLLWATFPLVGWGRFVVDPGAISCGPDWTNPASSDRSYAIAIFVLVIFVPITIIGFCYLRILVTIQKKTRGQRSETDTRSKEINVAFSSFITIMSFLVAWAPYGVLSIWLTLNDVNRLPQSLAIFAPLLAKSVSTWNPLVYVAANKQFRQAFVRTVFKRLCSNNVTPVEVDTPPR